MKFFASLLAASRLGCFFLLLVAFGAPSSSAADPKASEKPSIYRYLATKTGKAARGNLAPTKTPWVWCWEQYQACPPDNKRQLYSLVAEHLALADGKYLSSKEVATRRKGLGIAKEACRCAVTRLADQQLATAIADLYILPHLNDADPLPWNALAAHQVLESAADAYAAAKNSAKLAKAFELLVEHAPNRNTADAARFRLAQLLSREGRTKEALRLLGEIDENEGVGGARRMISALEKKK
jgi:hypothetical protein